MLISQAENNSAIDCTPPSSQQTSITQDSPNDIHILQKHHYFYNINYHGESPYFNQHHNFYNQNAMSQLHID